MSEEKNEEGLTLDKRTMDVLVANIIPTSKYFEVRFDHLQAQIDDFKVDLKDFRYDIDKRFEQVDKRFEQIIASIDRLGDKLDHRDENQRTFTLRRKKLCPMIVGIAEFMLRNQSTLSFQSTIINPCTDPDFRG